MSFKGNIFKNSWFRISCNLKFNLYPPFIVPRVHKGCKVSGKYFLLESLPFSFLIFSCDFKWNVKERSFHIQRGASEWPPAGFYLLLDFLIHCISSCTKNGSLRKWSHYHQKTTKLKSATPPTSTGFLYSIQLPIPFICTSYSASGQLWPSKRTLNRPKSGHPPPKKKWIAGDSDIFSCQLICFLFDLLRGSVRSRSGLSPEGCNFSRFFENGFQVPNIFQLLYYDVVREDFTKKNHLVTCFKLFYRCPTSLGNVHTYVRVSWCRNFIKSFQ